MRRISETPREVVERRLLERVSPEPTSGCWLWMWATKPWNGYAQMQVWGEQHAHRVAWRLFRGPIPAGLQVLHKCDVRCCVNPDHLYVGTVSHNMRDMVLRNRSPRGERHGKAILTEEVVRACRALASGGCSFTAIAKDLGVTVETIRQAVRGKCWGHVA